MLAAIVRVLYLGAFGMEGREYAETDETCGVVSHQAAHVRVKAHYDARLPGQRFPRTGLEARDPEIERLVRLKTRRAGDAKLFHCKVIGVGGPCSLR